MPVLIIAQLNLSGLLRFSKDRFWRCKFSHSGCSFFNIVLRLLIWVAYTLQQSLAPFDRQNPMENGPFAAMWLCWVQMSKAHFVKFRNKNILIR
jgi:hypothetical protein